MRKIAIILGILCLAACHSEDKTVVTPVTLEVKIDAVGATKASFSVTSSHPDATYIQVSVGAWEDYWYPLSDLEIAKDYLRQLVEIDEDPYIKKNEFSQFQDRFCFKGSRSFRCQFLASDMDYRSIVAQVDPFKKEVIGTPVSAFFHTEKVPEVNMDWVVEINGDVLTITPSDNNQDYYWDYESADYFWGNYVANVYYYLYQVTDMYEQYGFIEQELSRGPETYVFSQEDQGMVEGDTIILAAVAYANHELSGDPAIWEFEYHKDPGKSNLRVVDVPATKAPAPLQPQGWEGHRSRKNR